MRDGMLIIHFIGLAMGIGTSFAFMFLGMVAEKLPSEERLKFMLNSLTVSRMGHIGLAQPWMIMACAIQHHSNWQIAEH